MRIGQLAQHSGVSIDTIRFYEKCGLLDHSHVERGENGYRAYAAGALERLAMIKHAQSAGFTLSEIRELFSLWDRNALGDEQIMEHLRDKQRVIAQKIAELDHIHRYITNKIRQYEANADVIQPLALSSTNAS